MPRHWKLSLNGCKGLPSKSALILFSLLILGFDPGFAMLPNQESEPEEILNVLESQTLLQNITVKNYPTLTDSRIRNLSLQNTITIELTGCHHINKPSS